MKKSLLSVCILSMGLISATASAKATREEAQAFCAKAAAHETSVGTAQALMDWNSPASKSNGWFVDDLYVFAVDKDIKVLAHGANGKLVGKNLTKMKSQDQADGTKGFYFMQEMLKMSQSGQKGQASPTYNFVTPNSKKNQPRITFVYPYSSGSSGYFGCGYYL